MNFTNTLMNDYHRIYLERLKQSSKPFNARGANVVRCEFCRVEAEHCICSLRKLSVAKSEFLLLLHDHEVLKPSNTGRLVADVIENTHAFIWSRTEPAPEMLALLRDPSKQVFIVFPEDDKDSDAGLAAIANNKPPRQFYMDHIPLRPDLTPLFVLLDGSWREARKMFKKSPYLDDFPLVSFGVIGKQPIEPTPISTRYNRKAPKHNQLATAEVAAKILDLAQEPQASRHLQLWFDLFNFRYQLAVNQSNRGDKNALEKLMQFYASDNFNEHIGSPTY